MYLGAALALLLLLSLDTLASGVDDDDDADVLEERHLLAKFRVFLCLDSIADARLMLFASMMDFTNGSWYYLVRTVCMSCLWSVVLFVSWSRFSSAHQPAAGKAAFSEEERNRGKRRRSSFSSSSLFVRFTH